MTTNNSARDAATIKAAVQSRYGARAESHLREAQQAEVIPLIDASADDACCGPEAPGEEQLAAVRRLYEQTEVADLPNTVTDASLGCGNPTAIAELRPGETVLDLGSGGGIDCFLAAKAVGPSGHVIGVDMTPSMVELARRNAGKVGATNVEFRHGEIESLPVDDASVDVIISNCVINLSADKDAVLREAFRVLRPGGRFRVSDIVLSRPLSIAEEEFLAEWAGCVAGALPAEEFAAKLSAAGFTDVSVALKPALRDGVHSADITGRKAA
jgi:arsenite methyltransferase